MGRQTAESILKSGQNIRDYFKAKRAAQDFILRDFNGIPAHEYRVGDTCFILTEDETNLLARQFGSHYEQGEYGFDSEGRYLLINGEVGFTNGSEHLKLTVRNAQIVRVDMSQGGSDTVSFYGTQDQPLILAKSAQGSFKIESGVLRNWSTGETHYYSQGTVTARQEIRFIDFTAALSGPAAGAVQTIEYFGPDGISQGFEIHMDEGFRQELLHKNPSAVQGFWNQAIERQPIDSIPQDHVSWLESLDIKRHEFADQADQAVDKIFDAVKPQTGSLLYDLLLFQQTASVELIRSTIKGFIDVLRTGDLLDDIWDDAQGAWKDVHDGNLSDAGRKLLSLSGNSFIEITRALDLMMIGGAVRSVAVSGVSLIRTEVADFVGRLLRRSDDLSNSMLQKLFRNSSLKARWLKEVDSIHDVRRAAGKYVEYSEVKDLKFIKNAAEANAEYLTKHPGHTPPYKLGEEVKSYLRSTEELNKIGYVRIHATDNQARSWIITKSDFEKLKLEAQSLDRNMADYLKEKLNLTYTPTKVSLFEPPPGEVFAIRESVVNPIDPSSPNQAQYEILEEFIDRAWFKELGDL